MNCSFGLIACCLTSALLGCEDDSARSTGASGLQLCAEMHDTLSDPSCAEAAPPDLARVVQDECVRRHAHSSRSCSAAFDALYRCFVDRNRLLCAGDQSPRCEAEERAYAECVSGGTCSSLGGGSGVPPEAHTDRASVFTNSEVCTCDTELWSSGAPGAACRQAFDCSPVCCTCPGSGHQYVASACDAAVSAELQGGICPSLERTCALTQDRCETFAR